MAELVPPGTAIIHNHRLPAAQEEGRVLQVCFSIVISILLFLLVGIVTASDAPSVPIPLCISVLSIVFLLPFISFHFVSFRFVSFGLYI